MILWLLSLLITMGGCGYITIILAKWLGTRLRFTLEKDDWR